MNINYLESIYCFMYQARLDENHPPSTDATTGNIILSLCFSMIVIGILLLLMAFIPSLADLFEDKVEDMFGRKSGKMIAGIIVLGLMSLFFPIVKFTIGKNENYLETLKKYDSLEGEDKNLVVRKGKRIFYTSLTIFLLGVASTFLTLL